eukprot:403342057
MSGTLIYLAVEAYNSAFWQLVSDVIGFDLRTMFYMSGLFCGCICFLISFQAFISSFYHIKSCYIPLGVISFAMTSLLLSLGLITLTIGLDLKSYLTDYCTNSQFQDINQLVIELQDTYTQLSDTVICTKTCNCIPVPNQSWAAMGYDIKGNYFNGTLDTVESCLDYNQQDYYSVQVIKELEDKYSCSGVCQPKKFYLFSDVSQGPPTRECYRDLKSFIQKYFIDIGLGYVACAIIISFTWCFHVSFYFKEPEDASRKRILKYRNHYAANPNIQGSAKNSQRTEK